MFQAHLVEQNWKYALKTHLYKRFKIGAQGTSQGRYPADISSGHFENVLRIFLRNCKNKQQLTFKYFAQHIW